MNSCAPQDWVKIAAGFQPSQAAIRSIMDICHAHNASRTHAATKLYGIRVSLPTGDSFVKLIGQDWHQFHWYETEPERDEALRDMAGEHLYSRRGDRPTLQFEAVERSPND